MFIYPLIKLSGTYVIFCYFIKVKVCQKSVPHCRIDCGGVQQRRLGKLLFRKPQGIFVNIWIKWYLTICPLIKSFETYVIFYAFVDVKICQTPVTIIKKTWLWQIYSKSRRCVRKLLFVKISRLSLSTYGLKWNLKICPLFKSFEIYVIFYGYVDVKICQKSMTIYKKDLALAKIFKES